MNFKNPWGSPDKSQTAVFPIQKYILLIGNRRGKIDQTCFVAAASWPDCFMIDEVVYPFRVKGSQEKATPAGGLT